MKQAILIFEHARPNYLRVCLDSLALCTNIEQWPIAVSIDGPSHLGAFGPLLDCVPLPITWSNRVGNLHHVLRSLEFMLAAGCDRVLFLDGDCILRPDALTILDQPPATPPSIFVNLCSICPGLVSTVAVWFSPFGNLATAAALAPLLAWAKSGSFIGLKHPVVATPLTARESAYDAVFCSYMIANNLTTQFAARSYLGHIGISGVNHTDSTSLESSIFNGPPSSWLRNAARLFNNTRHPAFTPPDFRYED